MPTETDPWDDSFYVFADDVRALFLEFDCDPEQDDEDA